jgi:HPt (histidine-containing phosphotransfer) domain-containing protein
MPRVVEFEGRSMADDATRTEAALLDDEMIASLRSALGPAMDAVIANAVQVIEERVARLDGMAGEPLSDACMRLAHEIGGVAGQVGMRRLSREALTLEQLCRAGDAAGARALAGRIAPVARESLAAMKTA